MPNNLDRVKSSLELEENYDFRKKVFGTFIENPESAANMIVEFASSKCSVSTDVNSVISYIESYDDESDVELTPELLAGVTGSNKAAQSALDYTEATLIESGLKPNTTLKEKQWASYVNTSGQNIGRRPVW